MAASISECRMTDEKVGSRWVDEGRFWDGPRACSDGVVVPKKSGKTLETAFSRGDRGGRSLRDEMNTERQGQEGIQQTQQHRGLSNRHLRKEEKVGTRVGATSDATKKEATRAAFASKKKKKKTTPTTTRPAPSSSTTTRKKTHVGVGGGGGGAGGGLRGGRSTGRCWRRRRRGRRGWWCRRRGGGARARRRGRGRRRRARRWTRSGRGRA
mmetsp:Transcript_4377/g.13685  ORF Transcript_4377/g.13685 Transcript_4377/m.13685 type:complete len:211 (-) Transcript_4377:841-1473(-)